LSIGALLETLAIAASTEGWKAHIQRRPDTSDMHPTFDVLFVDREEKKPDPAVDMIQRRAVQRRLMSMRRLTGAEKESLERVVGEGYSIKWFETFQQRWEVGLLLFGSAHIRFTIPEAYETHRAMIDWGAQQSVDRIPDQALGMSAVNLKLMRFVLGSWNRVCLFNRFLGSAWTNPLQLDFIPALACGAHLVLQRAAPPNSLDDYVDAGRAVQRLWLAATALDLWQQPEMAPLIFAEYARLGTAFTCEPSKYVEAIWVYKRLERLIDADPGTTVWMGRIGAGPAPKARAVRLPLEQLLVSR
jgi:hypothetical protein